MNKILMIAGVILLSFLVTGFLRQRIYLCLYNALKVGDYARFNRIINGVLAKCLLAVGPREQMKLIAAMRQEDDQTVSELLNQMFHWKLTPEQLHDLLIRSFNYYAGRQNEPRVRRTLKEMTKQFSSQEVEKYTRHYEILFQNSCRYIRELESELPELRGRRRAYQSYLLYLSYRNAAKDQQAEICLSDALRGYHTNEDELGKIAQVI